MREALATGDEFADVVAELAYVALLHGDETTAADLRTRMRLLQSKAGLTCMGMRC